MRKVGDWVVTPRIGKPVEINALWYNALCRRWPTSPSCSAGRQSLIATVAERARAALLASSTPGPARLYDVIDGPDGDDATVRPNQILAVSLPHSRSTRHAAARVLALCGDRC